MTSTANGSALTSELVSSILPAVTSQAGIRWRGGVVDGNDPADDMGEIDGEGRNGEIFGTRGSFSWPALLFVVVVTVVVVIVNVWWWGTMTDVVCVVFKLVWGPAAVPPVLVRWYSRFVGTGMRAARSPGVMMVVVVAWVAGDAGL